MSLEAWLQERQYAVPYHWRQRPNDEREYLLRTAIVLELEGVADGSDASPSSERPLTLLDVGCGDGRFTADAARRTSAIGVDVSRRALDHARALVPQARFVTSGGAALPFRSEWFDIVTLPDVVEHIRDEEERAAVAEAGRVLRRGGRLIVSTNTDRSARELKHYRHYTLDRFRSLFSGFERLHLVGLIPYFPTLRIWMAAPIVWRLVRSRVRICPPEKAQVVIGAAVKT
jgi:SAM-dependent methyltransferase